MSSPNRNSAATDFGLLLIRIAVGAVFFAHGAQKLFGWFEGPGLAATTEGFKSLNIPYPQVSAVLAGGAEFVGGLALILGMFMRILILPAIFTMGVAVFHAHWANGYLNQGGKTGYEYPLTLGLVMLGLVFTGPGRFAIYEPRRRN